MTIRDGVWVAATLWAWSFAASWAGDRKASPMSKPWLSTLPAGFQSAVLWHADHEEGTLGDWVYADPAMSGGGVFNTGAPEEAVARVVSDIAFSGSFSVQTRIANAFRGKNGKKAVRLLRWTDKPWNRGGKEFPREAYYSVWMLIPENYDPTKRPPWDPGDGGWWNIFQFKSDDADGESQPVWTLNIARDQGMRRMKLYLYSEYNPPHGYPVKAGPIPVGQWFHVEAYYRRSERMEKNGEIALFVNGEEVFRANNVLTRLDGTAVIWGIGNYTDHIAGGEIPGTAIIYFDDAIVSTAPVSPYVKAYFASACKATPP